MSAKLAIDLYRSTLLIDLEAQLSVVETMGDTDFSAGQWAAFKTAIRLVREAEVPEDVGVSYRGRPTKPVFPDCSLEPEEIT
jgi:hypothetical protein